MFQELLGQLMQNGVRGGGQSRLQQTLSDQGLGSLLQGGQLPGGQRQAIQGQPNQLQSGQAQAGSGQGGLEDLIGSFLGGSGSRGGSGAGGGLGGLMEAAQSFLGGAGSNPARAGGIGALAGALLGGGKGSVKGALGGGALALLGTLAISALKNRQQGQAAVAGGGAAAQPAAFEPEPQQIEQMKSEDTANLLVEAMIAAAKSDGQIQDDEMQRIVGALEEGGITEEERKFVLEAMRRPPDVDGLCRKVPNAGVAAQVYAASLFAIEVDTPEEKNYLQQLAGRLGLDQQTVANIHHMTCTHA